MMGTHRKDRGQPEGATLAILGQLNHQNNDNDGLQLIE